MSVTFVEIVPDVIANAVYPDPEFERDVYEAPNSLNSIDLDSPDIFELMKAMQGNNPTFAQPTQPAAPPIPETFFSKFIKSKAPIVLIALTVYLLFAVQLEYFVAGAVFSSLIVWELFEFFLMTFVIKEPVQQNPLINLVIIFSGVSQQKSQFILKLLGLGNKIIKDIAIFMFTFVMIHLAWSYLIAGESLTEILDKDFSNLLKNDEL